MCDGSITHADGPRVTHIFFKGNCPFKENWEQERFIGEEYDQWANQTPNYACSYEEPYWIYDLKKWAGYIRARITEEHQQ